MLSLEPANCRHPRAAGPHRADPHRRGARARVRHRHRARPSSRAATSRPATCSTGSTRRRSRSSCRPPRPRSPRPRRCSSRKRSRPSAWRRWSPTRAVRSRSSKPRSRLCRQAEADVAARKADVARAKLNLDHTVIRAPISGRIGRALVTEGALVGQGEVTHLATIQQLNPIYADFTQSVGELQPASPRRSTAAISRRVAPDAAKVRLDPRRRRGLSATPASCCSRTRPSIPSTGQVTLRGEFPIRTASCCPACMCACRSSRASIPTRSPFRSRRSGATTPASSEVFVLRDDNRAVSQPVRLGRVVDDRLADRSTASSRATASSSTASRSSSPAIVVDAAALAGRRAAADARTLGECGHQRRYTLIELIRCRASSSTGPSSRGSWRC